MGLTVVLPGVATPPMPLSMIAASALLTNPQLRVAELPSVIVDGEIEKEAMFGVPEQVDAATVGAGVRLGAGAGARLTALIFTHTVTPKYVPLGLRNRQKPVYAPGVEGAVIGTSKSTVAPGTVCGTTIG